MTYPLLASGLLGGVALCAMMLMSSHAEPVTQDPAKRKDEMVFSGVVGEWWVVSPGTVQFQLLGSGLDIDDGKQPDLWFETPADKDMNTLFENLALDVVLYATSKELAVTVQAKRSSGDDGSAADKAFAIERIGLTRN